MKKDSRWDGQTKGAPWGIRFFMKLIRATGLVLPYVMLTIVAITYSFNKNHFKFISTYRKRLGLRTSWWNFYRHNLALGFMMIDRFAHLVMKKSPFVFECIGEQKIVDALALNKGLILLSAHIGNQEVAGDVLFDHVKTTVNYLMLDNETPEMKEVFGEFIKERNVKIIPTNLDGLEMMMKVKNALNNNEIVCMLGDRVMGNESFEEIPFLGLNARIPTYPFEVAALTGSPIVTAVTVKKGIHRYNQKVYDYLPFDDIKRSERKAYIRQSMEKYVAILEDMVRENPYQWFNFFDFWEEYKTDQKK